MHKSQNRMKRSQMPYQVSTSSIGDIIRAKADNGDFMAKKVVFELMGRGGMNDRSNDFSRG